MISLTDYYKDKPKTFANLPQIDASNGISEQHFPQEGLYVGQLEIDRKELSRFIYRQPSLFHQIGLLSCLKLLTRQAFLGHTISCPTKCYNE